MVNCFQDNVDFSASKTMTFDYLVIGSFGTGQFIGNGKLEILFTGNGTLTLWSKSYTNTSIVSEQKKDEIITLPTMPNKGRLSIKVTGVSPLSGGFNFQIDNIRIQ